MVRDLHANNLERVCALQISGVPCHVVIGRWYVVVGSWQAALVIVERSMC